MKSEHHLRVDVLKECRRLDVILRGESVDGKGLKKAHTLRHQQAKGWEHKQEQEEKPKEMGSMSSGERGQTWRVS